MSYITNNLMPGEQVIYRTRIHGSGYIVPILVATILLAAGTVFHEPLILLGVATLITLPWLLGVHLKRTSTEFAVTDSRIILKTGLLRQRSSEVLLRKIESVQIDQTMIDRLLGRGTLVFTGTGGNQTVFRHIAHPREFRRQVQMSIKALERPTAPPGPGEVAA